MSKNEKKIFIKDVEVPAIVQNKADTAFSKIIMEGTDNMTSKKKQKVKTYEKTRYHFKSSAAAAACICILAMGSITAAAAAYHHWSRGMQGRLQATANQQNDLVNSGISTILSEDTSYDSMQVTSENITIKPLEIIADGHFAHISFSIEGYTIDDITERCAKPDFERVLVTGEDGWVNMSGVFYDGIVTGINGKSVCYDNGEALEYTENGDLICHYETEDGIIELVMTIYKPDINENLLGDTIHVEFENLRTSYMDNVNAIDGTWSFGFTNETNGTWSFDITLPEKNAAELYTLNAVLGDTGALVKSVELSPISIKVNYDFTGTAYEEMGLDAYGKKVSSTLYTEPPAFCGVRLEDGTLLPSIASAGTMGYTDSSHTEYYSLLSFNRVIDTSSVNALLFLKSYMNDEDTLSEDNLYIVPINNSSK